MKNSVTPVNQLLDLQGKTAIVTGASGGIGRAIAQRMAEAGANVTVHFYSNSESADHTVESIRQNGGKASAIRADLRNKAECRALLKQTTSDLGLPCILVNNAGIQPVSNLLSVSPTETKDVLSTNIAAPALLTQLFAALQIEQGGANHTASITNIASIEGSQPAIGHAHYASSKAALIMFTRAAAIELGEHGIRVNAVSPGLINRDGLADNWPDGVQRYTTAAPLGRLGEGTDIADSVLFLSSSAARWITGSNLIVDGGVNCAATW